MMPAPAAVVGFAEFAPPPVDHDLQTALSLARASTAALLSLSALARREMITALTDEVALLHTFEDGPSQYAAEVLARYLPDRMERQDLQRIHLRSASRFKFKV